MLELKSVMENQLQSSNSSCNLPVGNLTGRVLPAALRPDRIQAYREEFSREFNPVGFTERMIVNDLARRVASMELLGDVTEALHRQGAIAILDVTQPLAGGRGADCEDAVLTGAIASGRIDECQRHSLGNSRAFYRALEVLRVIQSNRRSDSAAELSQSDARFATEADCISYLLRRFGSKNQACRRCGHTDGCWIASRRCWECIGCKAQMGLRVGTVMERSSLPLVTWFAAIRVLLLSPTISTSELSKMVGIKRGPTVRSVAKKIRAAMVSPDSSNLLASLDLVYLPT